MVQLPRLERGTFGATIRRSNQLSYSCMTPGTGRKLGASRDQCKAGTAPRAQKATLRVREWLALRPGGESDWVRRSGRRASTLGLVSTG